MAAPADGTDLPAIAGGKRIKTTPFHKDKRYGDDELKELKEALEQNNLFYAGGKKVKTLETEFAEKLGFKYAVATNSGTTSIHAAFIAEGISPGEEVIVTPITDMGSIMPILYQGAVPVFTDLDPHTYNLSPAAVEKNITDKTKAILAVHLGGNACDMDALAALAAKHKIAIIEDCAQAHGCEYKGKPVGHVGVAGCYSFNEFKHISCGDGGMLVTNDEAFAKRARLATDKCFDRTPGISVKRRAATFLANNYRMTELQGAVGRAQLRKLESIVDRRRDWCSHLTRRLTGLKGIDLPAITEGCVPSYWFYMMRVRADDLGGTTDEFAAALKAEGIPVGAHYITDPIYTYPLFTNHSAYARGSHPYSARSYSKGLCPIAEAILDTCVMLSINEGFSEQDLDDMVNAVQRVVKWMNRKVK